MRLWSPGAAPAEATANLDIPAGLALGKTLPLELMRPEARKAQAEKVRIPEEYRITDDFEIRQYWGCSETVLPGQPKIWKLDQLPAADREVWKRYSAGGSGGIEKPDWTEGKSEWGHRRGAEALANLPWFEAELGKRAFLAGDRYSMADITLMAAIDFGRGVGPFPAELSPNLAVWYERISGIPAVRDRSGQAFLPEDISRRGG